MLRRFKAGGHPEKEARVMEHARAYGFPIPTVLDALPDALVLERIDGRLMVDDLGRLHRWPLHARSLALLHQRLHAIPAPPELGPGTLLHMDLHPANVILAPAGPVVIDWTNASAGAPELDLAMTWLLMTTSGGRAAARAFARLFLRYVDGAAMRAALPDAAAIRLADRNVTAGERAAIERLVG